MSPADTPDPPPAATLRDTVDRYFVEHRAKLLDVAAFLDRCDRSAAAASGGGGGHDADDDFRLAALRRAVGLLTDGRPERTRRVLEILSDLSASPRDANPGGAACGATRPAGGTDDASA